MNSLAPCSDLPEALSLNSLLAPSISRCSWGVSPAVRMSLATLAGARLSLLPAPHQLTLTDHPLAPRPLQRIALSPRLHCNRLIHLRNQLSKFM